MAIRLTVEEMRFFQRNGFVIKRKVIDDKLLTKAHEVFWERAPSQLKRDDPASWQGPFREEFHFSDGTDQIGDYRWNLRSIGGDEWMMDLIPRNTDLMGIAEQLLGQDRLEPPDKARGIYTTLPRDDDAELVESLHVDQHVFHLGTVTYLNKVVTGGGGFRVWPASHLWFAETFKSRYSDRDTNPYTALVAFLETQPSLECTGDAGDVVFWHHRLAHMAGHNTSGNLRMAILYDFKLREFDYAREEPPQPSIWRDWPGLEALDQ